MAIPVTISVTGGHCLALVADADRIRFQCTVSRRLCSPEFPQHSKVERKAGGVVWRASWNTLIFRLGDNATAISVEHSLSFLRFRTAPSLRWLAAFREAFHCGETAPCPA